MSAVVADENPLTRKLWHIAGTGDLEQLEKLLNQGADVNAGDRTGVTALMRAAYHGQLTMVRALVDRGADPNAKDRSGLSALSMAKHAGHQEIVETLVSLGAETKRKATKPRPAVPLPVEGISPVTNHEAASIKTPHEAASIQTRDEAKPIQTPHKAAPIQTPHEAAPIQTPDETAPIQTPHKAAPIQTPEVRTLQEPPDIWDLVHTTQPESDPPAITRRKLVPRELVGRFVPRLVPGKFVSRRTLALGAAVLVVCAGVAFGLLGWSGPGNAVEEPEQRAEAAALEPGSASTRKPSNTKAISAGPGRITAPTKDLAKIPSVGRLGERTRPSAPPALVSAQAPAKKQAARQTNATNATAHVSRQSKSVVRRTTRPDSHEEINSKSAKKEQTPPPNDPVRPTVTQKPKVIQWP